MNKIISAVITAIMLMATVAMAADVTVKDVPEGAEAYILDVALRACDVWEARQSAQANLVNFEGVPVSKESVSGIKTKADARRVANGLDAKYVVEVDERAEIL